MGILRNHYSLILRVEPASEDLDSGPVRLRPADGDGIDDGAQRMFGFGYVEQVGLGSVLFQVMGSFGDGVWAVFAERQITDDAVHALGLDDIDMVPPFLRARVVAQPPDGSQIKPMFRAAFRLASSAPFRAEPATAPVVVERAVSSNPFDNGGGGV